MNLLMSSSVQVSVVVVIALAGAALLRGRSAAVRHWLLTVAVVCAALVPSLGLVVPRWQLPAFSTRTEPAPEPDVAVRVRPPAIEPAEVISPPVESARVDRLAQVGQWLVVLWLAGGAVCVGMLLAGCIRLATIVSRSRRVTDSRDRRRAPPAVVRPGRPSRCSDHPAPLVTWGACRSACPAARH
jgi:beta-lactamase regulating signal transducer with metallopeptidase domain